MDTSVLWVDWLGDKRAKLEVMGSSIGGHVAREKSRLATVQLAGGAFSMDT
jgi:hypothetical protein